MAKRILVADLLCGAGGSSTGCARALRELGLEMELVCVNHWPVAIETHKKNHPEARHYVQDIATVRPHILVPEGYLDLLMASPTCTHHSVARGGKPTSDQQRSDPWHIITWFTELRVRRAIIENVWEFTGWGPVDARSGRPLKSRKGEYFDAWIDTIRKLGATSIEYRKLNAANYGEATTRQRFIAKIRFDKIAIGWAPLTHRKRDDARTPDLFAGAKTWTPARDIIDWSIRGKSIFGRPKPLAPKTLARIYAGGVKFKWPQPFLDLILREMENSLLFHLRWLYARRNADNGAKAKSKRRSLVRDYIARVRHFRIAPIEAVRGTRSLDPMLITLRRNADGRSIGQPVPALAAGGTHIGIAEPVIMNGRKNNMAKGVSETPVPTLDTKGGVWIAEPFVLSQQNTGQPRSADDPLPTITTGGASVDDRPGCARPMIVEPFVMAAAHGTSKEEPNPHDRRVKSVDEPLGTVHAGGGNFGVVEPFILNRHGDNGGTRAHPVDEPVPTLDCRGAGYLVESSFVLSRQGGGAPRSVDDPTPAQVAKHSHVLISPYYGSGSGETCQSAEEPLPTVTSKGRFGMIMPVTHSDGSNRARDVDADPLPTLTTANRGELAFIIAQHGERAGQAPRVHDVDEPAPTIAATGHIDLVEGTPQFDILFRMLEPHELAAAMGFNRNGAAYVFAGTKTEQIKQIGNAVSVAMMKAEVLAIMADEAAPAAKGKRRAA